jgi:hypothetical protein
MYVRRPAKAEQTPRQSFCQGVQHSSLHNVAFDWKIRCIFNCCQDVHGRTTTVMVSNLSETSPTREQRIDFFIMKSCFIAKRITSAIGVGREQRMNPN